MNCSDSKQLIMEYLDGELAPAEKQRLDEHLAGCEACRAELAEQERVIHAVRTLPRVAAPPELDARVAAMIARENSPANRWRQWLFRYGAMAASLLIVVGAFTIYMKVQSKAKADRANEAARTLAMTNAAPAAAPSADYEAPAEGKQSLADFEKRRADDEYDASYATAKAAEEPAPMPTAPTAKDSESKFLAKAAPAQLAVQAKPADAAQVREELKEAVAAQVAEESRDLDAPKADLAPAKGKAAAIVGAKPERKAGYAEAAGFDIVIEADDVGKCINDLSAFLDARGYTVVARIRALRSVVLAEAKPAAAADKLEEAANAQPAGIVAQIAASGRFRVVSDSTVASSGQALDAKSVSRLAKEAQAPAERERLDKAGKESGTAGSIAILIIDRAADTPAADAEASTQPAAAQQEKPDASEAEPAAQQ